uniref:C2 domain-containing protein n=1 Tax=Loa loa TaxID=7209 RepID=A0A1I7VMS9_LOALO
MASVLSSTKPIRTIAAERRKKVFLGQLPVDFLRITVPSSISLQRQQQQSTVPFYVGDPNLVAQQALLQAQRFYSSAPPNTRGRISITVVEAKLVKNYGLVRMDPYCCVRVGNAIFETQRNINGGKTPKWNRIINAYLPYGVESFYLQVFDEKAFTADECIAWAHIIIPNAVFGDEIIDDWYQLSGQQKGYSKR